MEDLLQNDLFHLVFGILAAIFLLSALVNAIRSRIRNNRRETARMIKNNGNTGNEHSPVRLENPFAALEPAAAATTPAPTSAQTPVQAPATVDINGSGVTVTTGNPADTVLVEYDSDTDTYIIKVVNPKMMRVTVKKSVLNDYGINSFLFMLTLTDSGDNAIQLSNVYGTQGTNENGVLQFTLANNQTALLYVPRNAKVQIGEGVKNGYTSTYQIGPDANNLGAVTNGTTVNLNADSDKYVLFTNIREKVDVTVVKNVVGSGNTFAFTLQLKENDAAVR